MRFTVQQDIGAPIDFVFAQLTDFKTMERAAMRRGAEVQRVDELKDLGPGMAWEATFELRGKLRKAKVEIRNVEEPNRLVLVARSPSLATRAVIELLSLSRSQTRVSSDVVLTPKSLSAKLLVQSMKLARKNLNRRLNERLSAFAKEMEARFKKLA